jgi:hypothetical protein
LSTAATAGAARRLSAEGRAAAEKRQESAKGPGEYGARGRSGGKRDASSEKEKRKKLLKIERHSASFPRPLHRLRKC